MPNTARSTSRLMTKLKGSFSPANQQLLQKALGGVHQMAQPFQTAPLVQDQQYFDTSIQLDVLDKVVSKVEKPDYQVAPAAQDDLAVSTGTVAQALPTAVAQASQAAQAQDDLNPPTPAPTRAAKEAVVTATPDTTAVETGTGIGIVEYEKGHELPTEVEGYLQKVQDHTEQAPKEIVIADGTQDIKSIQQFPSQPVIVIPITPEIEKKGKRKNPRFSIRWLVEWSVKIMKAFAGKVIYRQASAKS